MSIFDRQNLEQIEADMEAADSMVVTVDGNGVVWANGNMLGHLSKKDTANFLKLMNSEEE